MLIYSGIMDLPYMPRALSPVALYASGVYVLSSFTRRVRNRLSLHLALLHSNTCILLEANLLMPYLTAINSLSVSNYLRVWTSPK